MTEDIIKKRLAFLNPTQFKLENESELHRGHKGNNGGEMKVNFIEGIKATMVGSILIYIL